jgi:hypothetical protein
MKIEGIVLVSETQRHNIGPVFVNHSQPADHRPLDDRFDFSGIRNFLVRSAHNDSDILEKYDFRLLKVPFEMGRSTGKFNTT